MLNNHDIKLIDIVKDMDVINNDFDTKWKYMVTDGNFDVKLKNFYVLLLNQRILDVTNYIFHIKLKRLASC